MAENQKLNVLVIGSSGAGKSTLIKAISGVEVLTGIGEGVTKKIDVYESTIWPIRCIDTKGFEYNIFEQWKTIKQIKKYTKEQVNKSKKENVADEEIGIDVIWYCIEGTSGRTFEHNIKLMNKATNQWKKIPVFAVITKSYSDVDTRNNIEAIKQAFEKVKDINLVNIIPVVAEEYVINEEVKVEPKGIEDLCVKTLDCFEEAKDINKENRDRMILNQKRFTANEVIAGATASAGAIGAVPIPFPDATFLIPLETGLTKIIFKIYGVDYSLELVNSIVGSTALTIVAKTILKAIPGAGAVANGVVAGAIVLALGEAVVVVSELIYNGKIDVSQVNEIVDIVSNNIKENPIVSATINYFEKNANKMNNKKSKEVLEEIKRTRNKK